MTILLFVRRLLTVIFRSSSFNNIRSCFQVKIESQCSLVKPLHPMALLLLSKQSLCIGFSSWCFLSLDSLLLQDPLFIFRISPGLPPCYSTMHLLNSICLSSCLTLSFSSAFYLSRLSHTYTYIPGFKYPL